MTIVENFNADRVLFLCGGLYTLTFTKDMESDYGVIPFPKYDEAQQQYSCRLIDAWLHCVPTTCRETERIGAVMQAIAYYSEASVYDAYFKQALTTRYIRDADSEEMIRLILSTLTVDLGDTVWMYPLRVDMEAGIVGQASSNKLASTLRSLERTAGNKCLKQINDFLNSD